MKDRLDKYFNLPTYWLFSASYNLLNKKFHFSQRDLKLFNKLYEQFLKQLNK